MNGDPPSGPVPGPLPGDRVLVCDGATGTMLHAAGEPLDRPMSELNLVKPRLVRDLHAAYLAAGADIVQTNTFDANRLRLDRAGLRDRVAEVNIAAARLAREAVRESGSAALVAGSVGPVMSATRPLGRRDREAALREQIAALANWVDLIILETFGDAESLAEAAGIALGESDLPVIAQLTFGDDGRTLRGEEPRAAAAGLASAGVTAVGANCTVGPAVLLDVAAELAAGSALPVSVQPNAGVPRRSGGQLRYARDTGYFAESARRFIDAGAVIVGGCCGTTPAHIRAIARAVRQSPSRPAPTGAAPSGAVPSSAGPARPRPVALTVPAQPTGPPAGWPHRGHFAVIAGVRAPHDGDIPRFAAHAGALVSAGADLLAIDGEETSASQVSPVAAAAVLRERAGADVLIDVEAAGRHLSALQADLLGGYALGVRTVVCRSGTPWVPGDYPDPQAPGDVDSVRLIALLAGLNEGTDWRGGKVPDQTRFVIGACLHTAAADTGQELQRCRDKAEAGAHFLITDLIYDTDATLRLLRELRGHGVDLPVLAVFAPFADTRAITRLIHEVPGTAVPSAGAAGSGPGDPALAVLEGVKRLRGLIAGALIHSPGKPDDQLASLVTRLSSTRQAS